MEYELNTNGIWMGQNIDGIQIWGSLYSTDASEWFIIVLPSKIAPFLKVHPIFIHICKRGFPKS